MTLLLVVIDCRTIEGGSKRKNESKEKKNIRPRKIYIYKKKKLGGPPLYGVGILDRGV